MSGQRACFCAWTRFFAHLGWFLGHVGAKVCRLGRPSHWREGVSFGPFAMCLTKRLLFLLDEEKDESATSDDSEDEGFGSVDDLLRLKLKQRLRKGRSRKRKRGLATPNFPRKFLNWTAHLDDLTRNGFRAMYRMSLSSFNHLLNKLKPYLKDKKNPVASLAGGAAEVAKENMLAMTLRHLAGGSVHDICALHNIGRSTFYKCVDDVLRAIDECSDLKFRFHPDDFPTLSRGFKAISAPGIEGCVGAIDGILIKIRAPSDRPGMYYSRKGFYGLNVQAICDSRKRVLHLSTLAPGRTNDCVAWRASTVHRAQSNGTWPRGYFIVGDAAYGNTEFCLSPFTNTQMKKSPDPKRMDSLNFYQSQMRIRIECCFGEVVRRWGVFWKPIETKNIEKAQLIISCAFKLHYFCVKERDTLDVHDGYTQYKDGTMVRIAPNLRAPNGGWRGGGLLNDVPYDPPMPHPSRSHSTLRDRIADDLKHRDFVRPDSADSHPIY